MPLPPPTHGSSTPCGPPNSEILPPISFLSMPTAAKPCSQLIITGDVELIHPSSLPSFLPPPLPPSFPFIHSCKHLASMYQVSKNTGLAKKFLQVFPYHLTEKSERTFGQPNIKIKEHKFE